MSALRLQSEKYTGTLITTSQTPVFPPQKTLKVNKNNNTWWTDGINDKDKYLEFGFGNLLKLWQVHCHELGKVERLCLIHVLNTCTDRAIDSMHEICARKWALNLKLLFGYGAYTSTRQSDLHSIKGKAGSERTNETLQWADRVFKVWNLLSLCRLAQISAFRSKWDQRTTRTQIIKADNQLENYHSMWIGCGGDSLRGCPVADFIANDIDATISRNCDNRIQISNVKTNDWHFLIFRKVKIDLLVNFFFLYPQRELRNSVESVRKTTSQILVSPPRSSRGEQRG